jgi:hypothetical protein
VQSLLSLSDDGSFTDQDVDEFVYNELMIRGTGARASVTTVFSRAAIPTSNITVRANFPVATQADEETGKVMTFVTTAEATLVAASAAAYYNATTKRYELLVPATAITGGSDGNVSSNRITRPLRSLNGFDTVFNRDAASGGLDPESTGDLINRYHLAILGSAQVTVNGIKKLIATEYPSVVDSSVVYGTDVLNTRGATTGGAVDVYFIGSAATAATSSITFTGIGQVHPLPAQPVLSISSITGYTQGIDYILVKDATSLKNSVRGADGFQWLATSPSPPAIGTTLTVTYSYNALNQTLQSDFDTNWAEPGRDILFKSADRIDTTISANIKIRSGFGVTTVVNAVADSLVALINGLKLGEPVEGSDLQAVARSYSAVDNFIITNLSVVGSTGTSDIPIGRNEYARIATVDLVLTVI